MSDQPGAGETMGSAPPQMTERDMMNALSAMGAEQASQPQQEYKAPEQNPDEIMQAQQKEAEAMAEIQKQMAAAAKAAELKDSSPVVPHHIPPPEKRGLIGSLFHKLKDLLLGIGRIFGIGRAPKMTASA